MLINALKKIHYLANSSSLKKFIRHNFLVFDVNTINPRNTKIALFELNYMQSSLIAYSYLASAVQSKYGASIVAYNPNYFSGWVKKSLNKLMKLFQLREYGAYKSFGVNKFIDINPSIQQKIEARILVEKLNEQIKTKRDIEEIALRGIWIGDLIYDTYLRRYSKATIELSSKDFREFLVKTIEIFLYWEYFFKNNDVCFINVSHCVYDLAIPLRIAISKGIPAFQSSITHVYRMSNKDYFAYNDFFYFPKTYQEMPEDFKSAGIDEAKRRIERRFAGEVGVDMGYSTKSAYQLGQHKRLLSKSSKIKILIATHCFFDSPHSYGNNLFPDFYEWLDYLGKISLATDYDWYIKTHPDSLPGNKRILEDFIKKYPKFSILPADSSHHQIIADGLDVALTVYGTIGFEYAALGIPIINCSVNNPHIAYDFNIHPKSLDEYHYLLINLEELNLAINKNQVYEYYFMRNIYNTANIFFNNYNATIKKLRGYSSQFTDRVYVEWIAEWTPAKHDSILRAFQNYLDTEDYRMEYKHFNKKWSIDMLELKD
jgi:hypothetical protein